MTSAFLSPFLSPSLDLNSSRSSFLSSTTSSSNRSQLHHVHSSRRRQSTIRMISLTRETGTGIEKRVVVTGTGLVSCFGTDPNVFYESLLEGKSGVKKIEKFDVEGWTTNFAAWVHPDQIGMDGYVSAKLARRLDPFLSFALVAGKKALEDAQIPLGSDAYNAIDKNRAGVIVGSGMGGLRIFSQGVEKLVTKGHERMSPFFIPYAITNMVR